MYTVEYSLEANSFQIGRLEQIVKDNLRDTIDQDSRGWTLIATVDSSRAAMKFIEDLILKYPFLDNEIEDKSAP